MKKRIFTVIALCALLLTASAIPAMSEGGTGETNKAVTKDETVYATLGYDGSVKNLSVVNHIDTPADGVYTDVGAYESVVNLTGEEKPKAEGGKVVWTLPARSEGFYYQGNLTGANLPYTFNINYTLNGKEIKAEELAGKAGKVGIRIKAEPNGSVAAYFKENFLCQIQLPLSFTTCANISAPGASTVLAGKTLTLAYMVLPGKSGSFTVTLDTMGFQMDGMSITCSKFDMSGLLDMDVSQIGSGITGLTGGMGELVKGTELLKGGLTQLAGGIASVTNASEGLSKGAEDLKNGVVAYAAAGKTLSASAKAIDDGLTNLGKNGDELAAKYNELAGGTSSLIDAMLATMSPLEKAAFEQQAEKVKAGLSSYSGGLQTYTAGVKQTGQGMAQFAAGMQAFAENGSGLAAGVIGLETGAAKLNGGLAGIAGNTAVLPTQTQKLVDGQKELLRGINGATAGLSGLLPDTSNTGKTVSFVSSNVSPRSVQFIIRTPAIKGETEKTVQPSGTAVKKSFIQKFLDLFR